MNEGNRWARLRLSVAAMASAWIVFPRRLGAMHPLDVQELGRALAEIAQDVRVGKLNGSTSIAIPYPRRITMKVTMKADGPKPFDWDFTMNYGGLSLEYGVELASLAQSFAAYITATPGSATSDDPTYRVDFEVTGPELPEPHKGKGKIAGTANDLQYSEMVTLQLAGVELLKEALRGAQLEIKSGQRK